MIGVHAPIPGSLRYDEPPADAHREREYDVCPRCGKRKAARSKTCRHCNRWVVREARRNMRRFLAWLEDGRRI